MAGNELSPYAAEYGCKHFQLPISAGRGEDVQQTAGSYDVVVMLETIEHVQSPRQVLAKAAELLRPGGLLVLTTPNIGSASFRLLRERWWVVAPKEHIFYFSPRSMAWALRQAGFRVRRVTTAGMDIHFLMNTLRGREAMPKHLAETLARTAPSMGQPARLSPLRAAWRRLEPRVIPALRVMVHVALLADQLVVYATKTE